MRRFFIVRTRDSGENPCAPGGGNVSQSTAEMLAIASHIIVERFGVCYGNRGLRTSGGHNFCAIRVFDWRPTWPTDRANGYGQLGRAGHPAIFFSFFLGIDSPKASHVWLDA